MAIQIQIRRGLASEWTSTNPTLAQGELAVELDTNKFKIGNGINNWNTLVYASNITSIDDIPGVNADSPLNGSVLLFNTSTNSWTATTLLTLITIDGGLPAVNTAGTAGGAFTNPTGDTNLFFPNHPGGIGGANTNAAGTTGSNGFKLKQLTYYFGGTGGGSGGLAATGAATAAGGNGGRGTFGSGGGGGGGGFTGATRSQGGDGGDGLVIATAW